MRQLTRLVHSLPRSLRLSIFLLVFLVLPPRSAGVSIDFESLPDGASLTTHIPGLVFSNATVLTAGVSLNEFEFPPHSGTNVVFDDSGPLSITFLVPVIEFSAHFTYLTSLTLIAFDAADQQVALVTSLFSSNLACLAGPPCSGDPASNPNELLSVAFSGGISKIIITGGPAGGSFVMDDVTVAAAPVPEPGSMILVSIIFAAGALCRLRLKH